MRGSSIALLGFGFSVGLACCGNVESESPSTPIPAVDGGDVTAPAAEASAADTGPTVEDCPTPSDVRDFTPSWKAPAPFDQDKCTTTQIEALASCNFDGAADQSTCASVLKDPANQDCNNCLFVASTAKALGPVVITGNIGTVNVAGCIANSEADHGATSCGAKYQAANDCADESCAGMDDRCAAALKTKSACISRALETVCEPEAAEAKCADSLLAPNGIAHACNVDGLKLVDAVIKVGILFCAGPPPDAGTSG